MPELLQFRGLKSATLLPEGWTEGTSADGEPWIEVNAVIFYVGKHRGQTYTREDLQGAVDRFVPPANDEDYGEVPIQLDHSMSTRDTVGSVRKVWMDGDELKARMRFEGAAEVKAVKRKKWRRLSNSFWVTKEGKKSVYTIAEVSITPFPELTGASIYTKETDTMPEPTPPAPEKTKEEHDPTAKLREEFSARMEAQKAEFDRQMAEQRAENAKLTKVVKFQQMTAKIESFCKTGKSVPAMAEQELALLESFSDEQMALYDKVKEAAPSYVDFETHGDQEVKAPAKSEKTDYSDEEARDEAAKFIEQFSTKNKEARS